MKTRLLPSLICWGLCLGAAQAADNGPRDHASGPYDPATGVYTVVAGDDAGPIAERFGLSLGQLEQLNGMVGAQIDVGQRLQVNETAVSVQVNMGPPAGGAANQAPSNQPAAVQSVPPDPWPREIQVGGRTLLVYQPQVVSWKDNQLDLRAAVAVKPQGKGDEAFGVVEAQARTQVDRVQRQVVLQDLKVTKAEFPSLPEMGSALSAKAAQQFASGIRVVPLDRLETALGVSQTTPPAGVQVQNPVPKVIVSTTPAVLVPIQGNPVLKSVAGTQFQRIVNTRAVILTAGANQPYYLHLLDGWVTAPSLTGPWTLAPIYPPELDEIASKLAAKGAVDLLNGNPSTPTLQILSAGIPTVYVSQTPTELIVFKGQPDLQPIAGTGLLWATNTSADVIVNTADNSYYALMAGRWYRAPSLQGTWAFVASTALPADFKKIPPSSPAGVVLASVAGTPQAKEAAIANSIPQTATVPLKGGPTFKPSFDGPPTVSTLPGTDLEYVVNTETPILRVNGQTYYALQAGVWFESASLDGPWTVARSVPAAIYTIPPSSPLYYATYVKVYGATPEAVYEGYTPGYLGAETTDDGVVVYGTGYDYQPWVGDLWYAAPETFGLAAQPVYNPAAGYAFGFGLGLATAAAAEPYWGGAYYRPYYAGYGCCAVTSANVYSHWGDTVADGTRSWYAEDGRVGTAATGTYTNWRTGTTGSYEAGRSYNPYTGEAQRGYGRTFETARGTEGGVERGERYNPATGVTSYGSRMAASGPEGGAVSRDTERAEGPYGGSAAAHQTTVTNPHTGETHSWDTARVGDNVYAGSDGNVYRHTDNGWQSHSASGWGAVGGDTSWADREQAARTESDARMDSGFGSADRFGGGGFGGFGNRFGGGGFGGGFGGRFGGGGFGGGRFGGFRR